MLGRRQRPTDGDGVVRIDRTIEINVIEVEFAAGVDVGRPGESTRLCRGGERGAGRSYCIERSARRPGGLRHWHGESQGRARGDPSPFLHFSTPSQ